VSQFKSCTDSSQLRLCLLPAAVLLGVWWWQGVVCVRGTVAHPQLRRVVSLPALLSGAAQGAFCSGMHCLAGALLLCVQHCVCSCWGC
jgi:hypothetical protein